ncbi:hypothetical protein [Embleya sp. NPDC059259]|uniref:hypothetical protein n=3 Tax=unclassified Embleya TaxID=2699296 RepID=UPI0036C03975
MASGTGADERDPLDQVVYRWSYGDLFGRQGMGPVAGSPDPRELREWDRGLNSHVSMDRSLPETPEWSMCQVHLPGDRHALILREAAIHGSNRRGNNAHVLLDPGRLIRPHTVLAAVWLHERYEGGLTGTGIPDRDVVLGGASIRPEAYRDDVHETIRRQARENGALVEVVLAAVMRNEARKFTLLTEHVGAEIVPLLWGVFDLAGWVAPGGRTFSTYETSDAATKPSFVVVPRWPNAPEPANRVRIDPDAEPGEDVFREAARLLVRRYREWSWEEMLGTLRELDDAVGADASNLERAEYVLGRPSAAAAPAAGPVSRDDPAGEVDSPVLGWAKMGHSRDTGVTEYDTWTHGRDEQDEPHDQGGYHRQGRYDESGDLGEQGEPGGYFHPDAPDRASAAPAHGARGRRDVHGKEESDEALGSWAGGLSSGPPVTGSARQGRPESIGPVNRPELARDAPVWAEWGRWDWEPWDDLTATWDGFLALRQAAERLAEDGGRETSGVDTAIDRADTGSLAVALLLVEQPLLGPVVRCLIARVEREYANPRGEWRSLRSYGEVLGRLHEGIAALADCGVDEGALRTLLWRMTRMVAEDQDRFPYFVAVIAGTVMRLRTFDGEWAHYQSVLVHAMSAADCYGSLQRECGRLMFEELGITPYRTEA